MLIIYSELIFITVSHKVAIKQFGMVYLMILLDVFFPINFSLFRTNSFYWTVLISFWSRWNQKSYQNVYIKLKNHFYFIHWLTSGNEYR